MIPLVAPLAGSVDRNMGTDLMAARDEGSLPSRGAWIEIYRERKEKKPMQLSLPSRGAWIEISRKEKPMSKYKSRSPRGERG